jgi:hypothetical protein
MPVIKPRTRGKQMLRHVTRFDRENTETLFAYAAFIGEPTEYVLNQLIETVLAKDKEYVVWRGGHPESCIPAPPTRARRAKNRRAAVSERPSPAPVTTVPPALVMKA